MNRRCWLLVLLALAVFSHVMAPASGQGEYGYSLFLPSIMGGGQKTMATYYVKVAGNDSLDGLSWTNAWATVNKAATTAVGGDTVIYGNGTYNIGAGQTVWNSGSSGNIITHQAFSSRLAIWENSTDTVGPLFGSVAMDGVSYITLDGIKIQSGGYYTFIQIYITGNSHHLEFNDVYLHDAADGHGMWLRYCHDIMVNGSLVSPESTTYGAREGILIGDTGTNIGVDITIQNTEISKTSHSGIAIEQCDGVTVDNVLIHDTASHSIGMGTFAQDIYVDDVEIKNSILRDSGLWVSDDPPTHNKNAIYISDNCKNIEIHHNDIYDHGLAALFVASDADGPIYFYNNTCYNCNLWDAEWVGDGYGYVHFYYDEAQTPFLYVKNNIFYVTDQPRSRAYHVTANALTNFFVADYNLLFADDEQRIRINSVSYTAFQDYLDAGYEANTVINSDPLFNNAGAADFTLQNGSPAIDQGVDLGYPFCGAAPDIGAHEYYGASTTATVSTTTLSTTSTVTVSTTSSSTLTTSTLPLLYAPGLVVDCSMGTRHVESLTGAEVAERDAIAAGVIARGF